MAIVLQILFTILTLGSLYTLVTVGFTLIYAVTKVLHVAQGVVTLLGAYLFAALVNRLVPAVAAGVFAIAACAAIGLLMNVGIFERLRRRGRASAIGALIASVALLVMGTNLLLLIFGPATLTLERFARVPRWRISGAIINAVDLATVIAAAAVITGVSIFLTRTKLGRTLRAVADNEVVAEVIGINARRVRHLAFALGSSLAGAAGILFALKFGLEPNQGVLIGLKSFGRAIIGGAGSVPGAIAGNLIVESAENVGAFYFTSAVKEVFSFAAIFVFLLLRPHGLFGHPRR